MDRRELAASWVGCRSEDLLGFKDYGDHVAVIAPDGKKFLIKDSELAAMAVVYPPEEPPMPKPAKPRAKAPEKTTARISRKPKKSP